MFTDETFLDVCASSDRVRDAWLRKWRRSRAISSVAGTLSSIAGMWMSSHGETIGLVVFGAGVVSLLGAQQMTTDIRMLRLMQMGAQKPT